MTIRTFRAIDHDDLTVVHDPASGLTHRAPHSFAAGRFRLDTGDVSGWPVVAPAELAGDLPLSVCWSPIVRCNLSCPYCLDDKTVTETGHSDRLPDLPDLAEILTAAGCVVSVTTNGWHLRRRAPHLAAAIDAIRVSLDGPQAWIHDAWRGLGSFDRAVAGIRAAVEASIPVQVHTVLMASTYRYLQETVELAAELGAAGVTVLQMLPIGEGADLARSELVSDQGADRIVDSLAVPDGLTVRLRTREAAGGFTVIRADGKIWRNTHPAEKIAAVRPLTGPADLKLTGRDGSA
jgi:molybdenum cofactor biosynthesis enzyme MoaA